MFELRVRSSFAAAHRLDNHSGKCRQLHGHTWEVEAVIKGRELDEIGMLVDFSLLKNELRQVVAAFDHRFLNDLAPFNDGRPGNNPTAENIARYIFFELQTRLADYRPRAVLSSVTVWEAPTTAATYRDE